MCGIGGFVDYERDARTFRSTARRMQRTLTPRGPDAAGEYCDSAALLVHRRLIVIDPDGGGQPMYAPDGNTILIYNGELYNTEELRRDLRARGHQFTGHSDTEVLLHAFLEWDTGAFARLNGIFAFAIWQKAERRLVLCRDRLGVKPLFFARTHELICDAAQRQLVSDVPLSCFLSGGLDSSILSMLAARDYAARGETLRTWSVDYRDNDKYFTKSNFQPNSDNEYIQLMVDALHTDHRNIVIEPDALCAALLPATDARDLPGMADVDSSLLLFCAAVKKGATVCLSGECADELFGGYPWYHREEILFEDAFPWSRSVDLRLSLLAPGVVQHGAEFVRAHYLDTCRRAQKLPSDSKKDARMREMFVLNLDWFMATLLDRKDRMSMYSGLEVRVPFCDHRIVEYAYNMPWAFKALDGREKGIVRKAFEHELPEAIVWRKKSPYPKTFHPVYTKLCADYVRRIFADPDCAASRLFNHAAVEALMEQPESLAEPWYGQLMRTPQIFAYIIQIDRWFKQYKVRLV